MKTKISIICGFLESGKTNFINSMLKSDELQNENIVVIQDEFGQAEIEEFFLNSYENKKITAIKNNSNEEINENYILDIINKHTPNRIFIEVNGMKNSEHIINIFHNLKLKKLCKIDDIVTIIDAKKFFLYFKNMKSILSTQIFNSEKIIFNNMNALNKKDFSNVLKEITQINETAIFIERAPILKIKEIFQDEYKEININHNLSTFKILAYMSFILFLFTYIITLSISDISIYSAYLDKFQKFYTIFISILIQGLPFILVGSFMSAVIQIYVPQDTFLKIFPKNIFLSCLIAAFAGLLFPICDCGTIPVVKGLIKKKIPIAAGITFMLAAPIVNPIAILSTMYAFQGMKAVVFCRIFCGIIISILVGLAMHFFSKKDTDILISNAESINCNCGFCNEEYTSSKSRYEKLKAVFIHTGDEFFNMGKFMIFGTFLSSIFQSMVSVSNNIFIPNDNRSSLIVMILLSFLLSVCSTSDAFIAKSFLKQFSINSVMGFLVVGPMLDIKNTIMIFGNFKKKFALKLIFFILIISFGVLINLKLS